MTKQFKDESGRAWLVPVNVATIRATKDAIGINLLDVASDKGQLIEKLSTDPITLCDVLFCLCREQALREGISDVQFGQGLAGDALESAAVALLEGLADFFPQGKRQLLRKALAKLTAYQAQIEKRLSDRLDSDQIDQQLQAEIDSRFAQLNN